MTETPSKDSGEQEPTTTPSSGDLNQENEGTREFVEGLRQKWEEEAPKPKGFPLKFDNKAKPSSPNSEE